MSLITQRPKHWSAVIGQDRALTVLHAILKEEKFLLRGFIFEGIRGVGKTTTAYLTARALMCTGQNRDGCGSCASCKVVDDQGIDAHPDFLEVAGAMRAGVGDARDILTTAESLSVLGRRRVVMIDEAHCLTADAWKVYLKPLELANTDTIIMFVSNLGNKIPEEIRGRCCRLRFGRVDADTILGYLVNVATVNQIQYQLDALRAISRASKGIVREALGYLDVCAALGTVTPDLVTQTIEDDLENVSLDILSKIASRDQMGAVKLADTTCLIENPVRLIEAMFSAYAKCVYKAETPGQMAIKEHFRVVSAMTQIFLKWATPQQLAADAMPLLIVELMNIGDSQPVSQRNKFVPRSYSIPTVQSGTANVAQFSELTGAKSTR